MGHFSVLVTGGAGFIGSALIWALNQKGIDGIGVVDALKSDERYKNLVPLRFKDYFESDELLAKVQSDDASLQSVETIYHLGACSSTTEKDGRYLIQNNYAYTKALAHWALNQGKRFIYASSAATYGDGSQGMLDEESSISKLRPLNAYAYSKQLFDSYALNQGWFKGSNPIVGLKYFNIYGPNEGHKEDMRSLVHKAFHQIRAQGQVQLFQSHHPDYKDGEQKRDFLYVKDAVQMTLALGEAKGVGGIFNISSGKAHSWLELMQAVFKALDQPLQIAFIPMPEMLRAKYQYFTEANIEKFLSFYKGRYGPSFCFTPLEEAVRDYVQRYLLSQRHLGGELF